MKTEQELKRLAEAIVARTIVDLQNEFPKLYKAIGKLQRQDWTGWLDETNEDVYETLLKNFGASQ